MQASVYHGAFVSFGKHSPRLSKHSTTAYQLAKSTKWRGWADMQSADGHFGVSCATPMPSLTVLYWCCPAPPPNTSFWATLNLLGPDIATIAAVAEVQVQQLELLPLPQRSRLCIPLLSALGSRLQVGIGWDVRGLVHQLQSSDYTRCHWGLLEDSLLLYALSCLVASICHV